MGRVLYWLAVLAVSLAIVVGLILLLERRDQGSLERAGAPAGTAPQPATGSERSRRANTTIRRAAL